jgi:diguanylate cyclase (GGDEF)-like protein
LAYQRSFRVNSLSLPLVQKIPVRSLQAFAEILKGATRVSDLCGHFGGDQLILVLSQVEKDNLRIVIDRLREKMAGRSVTFEGVTTALTASFGCACSEDCKPIELPVLLRQADAALLTAKRTG